MRQSDCQRSTSDFAVLLTIAAVAGAISQVAGAIIDFGRAAGWWP